MSKRSLKSGRCRPTSSATGSRYREVVHGAQRSVPWVRDELERLATQYVGAYEVQPDALQDQLGDLDLTDPSSMASLAQLGDPSTLLGAMRSERQTPMLESLQRFVSVLEGYTDIVVEILGERMMTSHARIDEALKRHRYDRGEAAAFVDRLLGLELDRGHYDVGVAFSRGVVERGGIEQLNRLWTDPELMPTPAELDAPGPVDGPYRPLTVRFGLRDGVGASRPHVRTAVPPRVLRPRLRPESLARAASDNVCVVSDVPPPWREVTGLRKRVTVAPVTCSMVMVHRVRDPRATVGVASTR